MAPLDTDPLRRLVAIDKQIAALNAQIAPLAKEREQIEASTLDAFAASGMQNVKLDGRTVYLSRELWAKAIDGDTAAVTAALKANGYADYVKEGYNSQSVSAWLRDLERQAREEADGDTAFDDPAECVPEDLRSVLTVSETFKIKSIKS